MVYFCSSRSFTTEQISKKTLKTRLFIENRLVVAKGEEGTGGKDWVFGISGCKLLYIGWINNKVLLHSTGNYIQYPGINHNGKEYEKEYMYITESLCCTAEINTTL